MRRAVLDAIETSRPLIDAGRHHLTIELAPPRALMVEADVTRLCQIVANLLNNAAKYTPEGGRIKVCAERDGDEAVIAVQDSGIGLTRRHAAARVRHVRAGRPLVRARAGRPGHRPGAGQAAGGDAWRQGRRGQRRARSRLPIRRAPAADPRPRRRAPRLDGGHELSAQETDGQRVLVVDDNMDSADSLAQVMQILGYPVAVAHDGVEAVAVAASWHPAVVLMDIGMPRLNGLERRAPSARSRAASGRG